MNNKNNRYTHVLCMLLLAVCGLSSCNEEKESELYINPVNLAVTGFSLTADNKNPGLDSVFFSIDLQHGVIFNADSLRKGTRIDKVIPKITFSSAVSSAVIEMTGGTTRQGEVDYQKNPTDSIDFTGNVTLRVTAADGSLSTSYRIKINIHRQDTDTLIWNNVEYQGISTRLDNPKAMKTVSIADKVISLVEEKDGTYSKSIPQSLETYQWVIEPVTFPFSPDVRTLTATESALWILDKDGYLWKGDETVSIWESTGQKWSSLIGAYKETVVGLETKDTGKVFAQYPLTDLNVQDIPTDFPVRGFSNFVTLSNKWTSSPVAFFTGGVTATGDFSGATWAFDGAEWVKLSDKELPQLEGSSIIPYYNFRKSATGDSMIEYNVWLLIGGKSSDGTFNRTVYISYNNGVDWTRGTASMQLPEEIPAMTDCDNVVVNLTKSANLSDSWKALNRPMRINYSTEGDIIKWECPYIFLFGGYLQDGTLSTRLWRGVLSRLTFVPII